MRKLALVLALSVTGFVGCSTHPASTSSRNDDLGTVAVADNATYNYKLSGGRDCRLDLHALANGHVLTQVVVMGADAEGHTRILARSAVEAIPGQRITIPVGDGNLTLMPQLAASSGAVDKQS